MIRSVLMLTPEAPYPLHGGGAYRTASLLHYFAQFATVDLILISESGLPALLPEGLVRTQTVIPLPRHEKTPLARYLRNARRAVRGHPPLIDRMSGLEPELRKALGNRQWDLGIVEHFWCAPYIDPIASHCATTLLDLHNVESVLDARSAAVSSGLVAAGHRRFASLYRDLEAEYLPRFSAVLAASAEDAETVRQIAPAAHPFVFANSIPWVPIPEQQETPVIVFSGNFEYHPNIDAVNYLLREIWPAIHSARPDLRLRLVGRGDKSIRQLAAATQNVEVTGPVEDARAEIAQARVVIAPLRSGSGTRIKILEAWAAARAVVATPLAAEGLAARHGENVLLAGTANSFAEAVGQLLAAPQMRERLALAGRHTFEAQYTWQAAGRSLDAALQLHGAAELNGYTE